MAIVYVIEDAADYRFLLGHFMKKNLPQHTIRFFEDGHTFCQQICPLYSSVQKPQLTDRPQLILMDLHMPNLNGVQTMTCLNRLPDWQSIPVIVLSSTNDQAEIAACYEAGAIAVMNKSISWVQLGQTIQDILAA